MAQEGLKIRTSKAGSRDHPYTAYSVTIPTRIAEAITDLEGRRFEWAFTDEGLLLRPVVADSSEEVPAWAR
jgi:hypothetical protein